MSAVEFLARRAIDIRVAGRYALANRRDVQGNRREFACRTSRMSPFQMLIAAPVLGATGERVISYFGEFGKLEGIITDTVVGGFLLDIMASKKARHKLAGKLSWLDKRLKDAVPDGRQQQRLIPENPHSTLIFTDGSTMSCFVIDMSPSGVAVSADVEPEIGTRLAVGCSVGQVIRRFNEGFAVRFDTLQEPHLLERMVKPSSGIESPFSAVPTGGEQATVPGNARENGDPAMCAIADKAAAPEDAVWYL